jgi:hypothetical protein
LVFQPRIEGGPKVSSILIEGREWIPQSDGGIYFSNQVWVDGQVVFSTGLQYGYGSQFEFEAISQLVERGYLPPESKGRSLWLIRQETGIVIYSVKSSVGKREMFKDWDRELERQEQEAKR